MSVCFHLSLRPTFWMDAAGFEPFGFYIAKAHPTPASKLAFVNTMI